MAPSHLHPDYLLPVAERRAKWRQCRSSKGKICPDCQQVTIGNDALYCRSCGKKAIHRAEYAHRRKKNEQPARVTCPDYGTQTCIECRIVLPKGCDGQCHGCTIVYCPCLNGGLHAEEEAA